MELPVVLLGIALEPLEDVIRVEGHGVSRTFAKEGTGLADRVEAEPLELDHRVFAPNLVERPGARDPDVAADSLAHETAQTDDQGLRGR
jgi:hypothetical protein